MCKMIADIVKARRPKTPNENEAGPAPVNEPNMNVNAAATKFRIRKNLIEQDIKKFLGPAYITSRKVTNVAITNKADNIYKLLGNALRNNRLNLVAANIKEFKKGILKLWKEELTIAHIRSTYNNIMNNGVRKAVQNFAVHKNKNGQFPPRANVMKFKNARNKVARIPPKKLGAKAVREEM